MYSSNSNRCNYDQGGLWVAITNTSDTPSSNNVISVDLFYWYNRFFNEVGVINHNQKVWIWVSPHDGGMNPYTCGIQDYLDNTGSYRVWVTTY